MMNQGVLLAGGYGTRLGPLTKTVNKHFLPIFDKPLIFYSLSTMILSGVKNLVVVCASEYLDQFKKLLGDGSSWGINISFAIQNEPEGIPHGLLTAEPFLKSNQNILLGLGDNVLYGTGTGRDLLKKSAEGSADVYCFQVTNPSSFGVVEIDSAGNIVSIEEKPENPKSNLALTGFYSLPYEAISISKTLPKSKRGELEIVDLLQNFHSREKLRVNILPRGTAWLDAGSQEGLLESSEFVHAIQNRQGYLVGSPDEASWQMGNIDTNQLLLNASQYKNSEYSSALNNLVRTSE